jgi:hypothetical protein
VGPILALARELMDERPRTRQELRPLLGARWPGADREALVYAVTYLEPLVQVTPRGLWKRSGQPTYAHIEAWLGRPLDAAPSIERIVLRYLAAFGPASIADAQAWSGLTRLSPVFERLRASLATFRAPSGRELFDLPDAPRPDEDVVAPVRFLPQYDNLLLGHADRSRMMHGSMRDFAWPDVWVGPFLVDGTVAGHSRIVDASRTSSLHVTRFRALASHELVALEEEAAALLALLRPDAASYQVRIVDRD